MKKLIIFFIAILSTCSLFAQAPQKMSYQAVIRNSSNELVASKSVGVRVSIIQGTINGAEVYKEIYNPNPQTNANGLLTLEVGGGIPITGVFANINWANGPYFIKTETDPNGGTTYSITATAQLLSVPYALYAGSAGNVTNAGGFKHYIGEKFGGGVIFHLWKDELGEEHGLIVALTDQSAGTAWSNVVDQPIGAAAQSSWDGLSNSNAVVAQSGHISSAAKLCLDLISGGKSDWYLPSIQELNILWNNYYTVARALSKIAGATQISNENYWSSTENSESGGLYAWYFVFSAGYANYWASGFNKDISNYVRAIRAF